MYVYLLIEYGITPGEPRPLLKTCVITDTKVYYGTTYKQNHAHCFRENSPDFL